MSKDNTVYTYLYIGNSTELDLDGTKVGITQNTTYPWDGKVSISINLDGSKEFGLGLRMPGWCNSAKISVNGEQVDLGSVTVLGVRIFRKKELRKCCVIIKLTL